MKSYIFVFSFLSGLIYYEVTAEKINSGPYRSIMLNTTRCEKPSLPYQKVPSAAFFVEVYNTTKRKNLMRGNITIFKEFSNYKIKVKTYVLEDSKWKISFVSSSSGCRGVLLTLFASLMGLNYDKDKCIIKKGTYSFSGIDTNQIEHKWTDLKIYGPMITKIEVCQGAYTAECWEFYETVVPKDSS